MTESEVEKATWVVAACLGKKEEGKEAALRGCYAGGQWRTTAAQQLEARAKAELMVELNSLSKDGGRRERNREGGGTSITTELGEGSSRIYHKKRREVEGRSGTGTTRSWRRTRSGGGGHVGTSA